MSEMIKQMQKRIVRGVQPPDKGQQNQLGKDAEQTLQESIKDLAEHSGGPQAEDRFWKRLEHIATKKPKNRIVYQRYQDISYFWQYMESWCSYYPPNLSEGEGDKTLSYARFKRKNMKNRERYMTVHFPCGGIDLKGFFVDNRLPENCGRTVYGVYCENEKAYTIGEMLEKLPKEGMDIFQPNELFYRSDKLPGEMQCVYGLMFQLKESRNVKGMTDLMEHPSEVCTINGVQNERQLGELLMEGELFDVSLPDGVLLCLDYAKIGREHMQTHQGKLIQGAYAEDASTDNVNQFNRGLNEGSG